MARRDVHPGIHAGVSGEPRSAPEQKWPITRRGTVLMMVQELAVPEMIAVLAARAIDVLQ